MLMYIVCCVFRPPTYNLESSEVASIPHNIGIAIYIDDASPSHQDAGAPAAAVLGAPGLLGRGALHARPHGRLRSPDGRHAAARARGAAAPLVPEAGIIPWWRFEYCV